MRDFAWLLRRHEDRVLAWFKLPLDNGATEAMNNSAKAVSHRAPMATAPRRSSGWHSYTASAARAAQDMHRFL